MRPSLIIPRLREQCPIFNNRVAGAATFAKAADNPTFAVPHAFVLPLSESATGDTQFSGLDQELMTRLAITVCVANEDDRGQQSLEVIYDIRAQLLRALVGWQPGPQFGPLMYVGMPDEPAINRARVWLQFDFQGLDFTASAV